VAFDVFISYATHDGTAAAWEICEFLEIRCGLRCWIAPRNIGFGQNWPMAVMQGLSSSRLMLLLKTSGADESQQVLNEVTNAVNSRMPLLPVILDPGPAPHLQYFLTARHWFDATRPPMSQHLAKLGDEVRGALAQLGPSPSPAQVAAAPAGSFAAAPPPAAPAPAWSAPPPPKPEVVAEPPRPFAPAPSAAAGPKPKRIALLYKRDVQPDAELLATVERELRARGMSVFIDRHIAIGVEWAEAIKREIETADAVVPLLSAASVGSEMLRYEIQLAHHAAQKQKGKPRILPVRIGSRDKLPDDIAAIIDPIEWHLWEGPHQDERMVAELVRGIENPDAPPARSPLKNVDPTAALPVTSEHYVVRPTDEELMQAISRRDSIVLLKGARQMGKTSLLARGLQHARKNGFKVALTDFQKLNADHLDSAKEVYLALAAMIADQLDLDDMPEDTWDDRRAPNVNFERFLRRKILKVIDQPLVWALDEVDRLFEFGFSGEVFGLFRSWHNERALDPSGPWSQLTMAIAYATEAHLFITDLNQSPFNVGTRLALSDFTLQQIADLNRRYGSPIADDGRLARFYAMTGGQPFLAHRGLSQLSRSPDWGEFERSAAQDNGPYGDHLRRLLVLLAEDQDMLSAVRELLAERPPTNERTFYRLRSGGLLSGETAREARLRCDLYGSYLRRHLL